VRLAILAGGISLALAANVAAQRHSYGSRSGFGNILYPGTGHAPSLGVPRLSVVTPRLSVGATTHAQRLGQVVAGTYRGSHFGGGYSHRGAGGRTAAYAVPVFVGGYGYGYGYGYAPPPEPVYVPEPQQAPPTVIINQYFSPDTANAVVHDYTSSDLPQPALKSYQAPVPPPSKPAPTADESRATIHLIAYKDQTIYPAVGYWIEGETLNYITLQGTLNRASLELIDKEFSEQLNRERGVEFSLDPAP
jgi:hypothetical protein